MDIEKLLAKQRKLDHSRSNEPITSGEDKGQAILACLDLTSVSPDTEVGRTSPSGEGNVEAVDKVAKQRMKVSPTGDTPIGRVNDIIGY